MAQVGKKYTKWILFLVLLVVAAFIIFPILVVLMNSVKANLFISSTGAFKLPNEQSFVGISNYMNGIEKISFFSAFGYSLWITIASVFCILLLTSMLAWYITRVKGKVTSTIYYLLVFSMIVPFQMVMFTMSKFANMIHEAEKYLGFPYVWGGSSPSTSFDCSGFVCWVINNCGNGWNVGRTTANGLMSSCDIIPASEAQPGDLIFFQGTYDTAGASHVGIYVGGGMMIHCGNPISYASIETSYWQSHFYAYGRIR